MPNWGYLLIVVYYVTLTRILMKWKPVCATSPEDTSVAWLMLDSWRFKLSADWPWLPVELSGRLFSPRVDIPLLASCMQRFRKTSSPQPPPPLNQPQWFPNQSVNKKGAFIMQQGPIRHKPWPNKKVEYFQDSWRLWSQLQSMCKSVSQ